MAKAQPLFLRLGWLALGLFVSACQSTLTNYTPERIPQNPSGIYTFSFAARRPSANMVPGSDQAFIVLNGERYPMVRSPGNARVFVYDYRMPPGITEARYWYEYEYCERSSGSERMRKESTLVQEGRYYVSNLTDRFALQLLHDRGPVGARIPVVGSGFEDTDIVVLDDTPASTTVETGTSLVFTVPAVLPGRSYQALLRTATGDLFIGSFRVDAAGLRVSPLSVNVKSGETVSLDFELDEPAPVGGLYVEVTTDIPESVILPEVLIPAGERRATVTLQGGTPASGYLYVGAPGHADITVPVSVN